MDTTAAWKKNYFILSDRSGFHMTDSLSIAVHAFAQANTTIWRHHMDADEVYEEKAWLDTRMLRALLNKSRRQHPTK